MNIPLSEQMRPKSLQDVFGQNHLLGQEGFLTKIIEKGKPLSIVLWGPPGSGKTTIARLYAKAFNLPLHSLSAVSSGVADLKQLIKKAEDSPLFNASIVLFIDEIHRYNKAQQDVLLPYMENGTLVLIGATAENPSFYLNKALLSRTRVLPVNPLDAIALEQMLRTYESRFEPLPITSEARKELINLSHGDGRYLLNLVENLQGIKSDTSLDTKELHQFLFKRTSLYDREGDQHYNLISALHKAVRGSDPDAALYWFTRMLEGGEERLFLARRLIRMASEDVGLADPQALSLCIAARDAYEMLGSPEGELALAEAVLYLALAPKSNALYTAYGEAKQIAEKTSHLSPPSIILNAPTQLMKDMDYGKGYQYDHDTPHAFSGQDYFPQQMGRQRFYHPVERGFEREMRKRIAYFEKLRKEIQDL
jgi:putative ATPase